VQWVSIVVKTFSPHHDDCILVMLWCDGTCSCVQSFDCEYTVPGNIDFPETENHILEFWDKIKAFETSLELSKG
jgi:hypothetical protein